MKERRKREKKRRSTRRRKRKRRRKSNASDGAYVFIVEQSRPQQIRASHHNERRELRPARAARKRHRALEAANVTLGVCGEPDNKNKN